MARVIRRFGRRDRGVPAVTRRAAYAVVMSEDARILVVQTRKGIFLPGGGSAPNEAPRSTVVREALEETGCEIEIRKHLGCASQYFTADGVHYAGDFSFFLASIVRDAVGPAEHDFLWVPADELSNRLYHPSHEWAAQRASDEASAIRAGSRRSDESSS